MKTCPQCLAQVFDDLDVCYECMYRFGEEGVTAHLPRKAQQVLYAAPAENSIVLGQKPVGETGVTLHMKVYGASGYGISINSVQHLISGQKLLIGCSDACDLIVHDSSVSKKHACISISANGALEIEDISSANGTFVNGRRVQGKAYLEPGCEVGIGTVRIVVDHSGNVAFANVVDINSVRCAR